MPPRVTFSEPIFIKGMDDTRKRVAKCYPFLNLDFLDEDNLADDAPIVDASAKEV